MLSASQSKLPNEVGQLKNSSSQNLGLIMLNNSTPGYIKNLEKHLQKKSAVHDFYAIDLGDSSLKHDTASMEAPLFSLAKQRDIKTWTWTSADGKKSVKVMPNVEYGRATIFDKDVLIYAISCLVARKNSGLAASKTVRFSAYAYFKATHKDFSKGSYQRLEAALDRLHGTSIETNIKAGNRIAVKKFHILEDAQFVKSNNRLEAIQITLSDWLYNSIDGLDVLTLNRSYFQLHRPLERRLYEIARKHCASKSDWVIGFDNLLKKAGSRASSKEFKRMLKEVIESDLLPDFRISLSADGSMVKFYQKDQVKLAAALGFQSC